MKTIAVILLTLTACLAVPKTLPPGGTPLGSCNFGVSDYCIDFYDVGPTGATNAVGPLSTGSTKYLCNAAYGGFYKESYCVDTNKVGECTMPVMDGVQEVVVLYSPNWPINVGQETCSQNGGSWAP